MQYKVLAHLHLVELRHCVGRMPGIPMLVTPNQEVSLRCTCEAPISPLRLLRSQAASYTAQLIGLNDRLRQSDMVNRFRLINRAKVI